MPLLLILQFPILTHCAVLLDYPSLKLLAIGLLIVGVSYNALVRANAIAWLIALGLLVSLLVLWQLQLIDSLLVATPILIPLMLLVVFGTTLRPGQEALVTQIGERARGPLEPEMRRYTRNVTWLWTVVFFALTLEAIFLALYANAVQNFAIWSWLINIVNPVFIGSLFVLEFIYRKRRFPDHPHPSFMDYLSIVRNAR